MARWTEKAGHFQGQLSPLVVLGIASVSILTVVSAAKYSVAVQSEDGNFSSQIHTGEQDLKIKAESSMATPDIDELDKTQHSQPGTNSEASVSINGTTYHVRGEGKRTYLIERFMELGSASDIAAFQASFGNPELSETAAESLRQLLIESGAVQQTKAVVETYVQAARNHLSQLQIRESSRAAFELLITLSTNREA